MTNILEAPTVQLHPLSGGDPRGALFTHGDRLLRGIPAEAETEVRELLDRGILDRLAGKGMIPRTSKSTAVIPGYPLVLEHEVLPCVTYAHEWTYTMLQDAALFVLRLREELVAEGFDLADAHCDNVTFHQGRPVWLDIGSLMRNSNPRVWVAERRYRQSFEYPLQIWRRAGDYVGRRLFAGAEYVPREAAWTTCTWWAKWLRPSTLRWLSVMADAYAAIPGATVVQLRARAGKVPLVGSVLKVLPAPCQDAFFRLVSRGGLPGHRCETGSMARRIQRLAKRGYSTVWENYHTGVLKEVASFEQYPRFQRVVAHIEQLRPGSVTEIGANQGALARLIQRKLELSRMVCLDIDDGALDRFYLQTRGGGLPFYHAVIDTMRPFGTHPKIWPEERFRSEMLVALAVTHHMVLGQSNSVEYTLRRMAQFTSKWIMVEYMPWGLSTTPPEAPVPPAYAADRFDRAFRELFTVIAVEQLEPTRTLYVGSLRPSAARAANPVRT
jgi:hypothetical protein